MTEPKTIMVTPALAAAWLATTTPLRPPWQPVSQRIAADIEAGRWQPERGLPVSLTGRGLNGDHRHRLAAIVAAGIAVPMRVEGLHVLDDAAGAAESLVIIRR
jgi:hypothetical protein